MFNRMSSVGLHSVEFGQPEFSLGGDREVLTDDAVLGRVKRLPHQASLNMSVLKKSLLEYS